jgi:hypothetical protein
VVPDWGVARQRGVGNNHILPCGPEHQTKPPASNQTPNQLIHNKPLLNSYEKNKMTEDRAWNVQFEKKCKVPSGLIWSAWEWYHWIGLEKDINRYRFLILNLNLEYLKRFQSSGKISCFEELSVRWRRIRKYLFRIRLRNAVNPNYGSGSYLDICIHNEK